MAKSGQRTFANMMVLMIKRTMEGLATGGVLGK